MPERTESIASLIVSLLLKKKIKHNDYLLFGPDDVANPVRFGALLSDKSP